MVCSVDVLPSWTTCADLTSPLGSIDTLVLLGECAMSWPRVATKESLVKAM